jgi:predicted lipoprotein with Yx(FWY)xxD motif
LAATATLALTFAACGGDDDDDNGDAEPTATTAASQDPTAESEETPDTGGASSPAAGGVSTIVTAEDAELGTILTTLDGFTLYTFDNDVAGSGTSACEGGCASAWPPLPIAGGEPTGGEGVTGELDTISRPDGLTQVTYNGKPLYLFANDAAPGDTNGAAVPNWAVAVP